MTKEFFVKAGTEDGIPARSLEILWEGRPSIVDHLPENEDTRQDLRSTNADMKDDLIELASIFTGEATA